MAHERVIGATQFERVWQAEYAPLVNFLRFLGADHQEAQDAAQTAFMELFRHTTQVTEYRAWLRKVAERSFWSSNAKTGRQHRTHERVEWPTPVDPVREVIHKQEVAEVLALVQHLPPAQRRVFAWRMDGFEFTEIAEAFGRPEGTIRSNFRHAVAGLKKLSEVKTMRQRHKSPAGSTPAEGGMDR